MMDTLYLEVLHGLYVSEALGLIHAVVAQQVAFHIQNGLFDLLFHILSILLQLSPQVQAALTMLMRCPGSSSSCVMSASALSASQRF